MNKKRNYIYENKAEAFLVCDRSLGKNSAPFFEWLCNEGFTNAGRNGNYGCPWIYVNITHKQYAYGMPGVEIVKETGNHSITIDEFITVYSIFKKYRGKDLFVFKKERFDYD